MGVNKKQTKKAIKITISLSHIIAKIEVYLSLNLNAIR